MTIKEKLKMDKKGFIENGAITVVVFGDSVSYGAFGNGEVDYEAVYWNRFRNKIYGIRKDIPVNVINSAIGSTTAKSSLERMEKQVFQYKPDLLIVSFGLNDINYSLEEYLSALEEIFKQAKRNGVETVFMSENMLNTYIAEDTQEDLKEYARITAEYQNSGKMDKYMYAACDLARSMGILVSDCYSKWKKLSETEDITMFLDNRINHPSREMHKLFAETLFETIFDSEYKNSQETIDTMWRG